MMTKLLLWINEGYNTPLKVQRFVENLPVKFIYAEGQYDTFVGWDRNEKSWEWESKEVSVSNTQRISGLNRKKILAKHPQ